MSNLFDSLREFYIKQGEDPARVDKAEQEVTAAASILAGVVLFLMEGSSFSMEIEIKDLEMNPKKFRIKVEEIE